MKRLVSATLLLVSGCGFEPEQVFSPLAPLVQLEGQAFLPAGFQVSAIDSLLEHAQSLLHAFQPWWKRTQFKMGLAGE